MGFMLIFDVEGFFVDVIEGVFGVVFCVLSVEGLLMLMDVDVLGVV